MIGKVLSKQDAAKELKRIMPELVAGNFVPITPTEPKELRFRQALIGVPKAVDEQRVFEYDIQVADRIYFDLLGVLNFRTAADDSFWRYLQIKLVPDIVYARWKKESENLDDNNQEITNGLKNRFYASKRRIWLKALWWFAHFCNPQENDTDDRRKCNERMKLCTTDTLVQIIERSGSDGYRVRLYRDIIREYTESRARYQADANKFRMVMKRNTLRLVSVEPELSQNTEAYVRALFTGLQG